MPWLFVLAVVVGLAVFNLWRSQATTSFGKAVVSGSPAPDFTVRTIDGQRFTLSEQRGKPVALFFVAAWCTSCIPEAQAWARIYEEYKGSGLQVLALDVDATETSTDLRRFKEQAGNPPYLWALDTDNLVTRLYRVRALDTTIIIDPQGRIAYHDEVPTLYPQLKAALEKLLPTQPGERTSQADRAAPTQPGAGVAQADIRDIAVSTAGSPTSATATLRVTGLSSGRLVTVGCCQLPANVAVPLILQTSPGVQQVTVDEKAGTVTVFYNPQALTPERLREILLSQTQLEVTVI